MSAVPTIHPLKMSPPNCFVTPPTPRHQQYTPHATTSPVRITSPIILIPGNDPLSTTLTPKQLGELLPTLHVYIEPSHPSLALLPATGVSYTGLQSALRWREAEYQDAAEDRTCMLDEMVQIYQSLAFLGHRPTSRTLLALSKMIRTEIADGISLGEFADIWALRHLPFTECFVDDVVARLAKVSMWLDTAVGDTPRFQARVAADDQFAEQMQNLVEIMRWVNGDAELMLRVARMRVRIEDENGRAKRMQKQGYGGSSVVRRFKTALEPVME